VDPYCLFRHASPVPESVRSRYGQELNQPLWKIIAYNSNPRPNLLLGNSEVARLPEQVVTEKSGKPYANLAFGGGSLRESISTFWFVSNKTHVKQVYFGVSFMDYNALPKDRVILAEQVLANPVQYFVDSDVLEAGLYDVGDAVFHHATDLGPKASKDAFWQLQLHDLSSRYKRNADPGPLKRELRKIIDFCRTNGVSFVFVITPEHVDAQRRVGELGVEGQYRGFVSDLAGMAPVYDCDFENSFTRNRNNFMDPFHLEKSAAADFVADLWSAHPTLCRTLGSH
jgi:hypothetical protein